MQNHANDYMLHCNMTETVSHAGLAPEFQPAAKKPARTRARIRNVSISAGASPAATAAEEQKMEEQINAAEQVQADAAATLGAAGAQTQDAMARGTQLFAEWGEFSKGNVEAVMESGRIAARGFEAMGQEVAAHAKRSYEGSIQAMRTLTAVKSPAEMLKMQGDLVRQSFDALVAVSSRNTEATLKLAGEIAQPIQNRIALAAEKVRAAA